MSGLMSSEALYRHSLDVFAANQKLIIFPLLSITAAIVIGAHFLPPMLEMSAGETWSWVSQFRESTDRPSQALSRIQLQVQSYGALGLVSWYMATMVAWTFVNAAFYSECTKAMNGDSVSLSRGFAVAARNLPAILCWALFAGTLGLAIRAVQRRLPFVGHLTGAFGFLWSVGSQFVIPVILNESRLQSPITYLRISARLVQRVWSGGLTGLFGVTVGGFLLGSCLFIAFATAALATQIHAFVAWGILVMMVCWTMQEAINAVFRCSVYIYATEGVAPGPFDPDVLGRAWSVK